MSVTRIVGLLVVCVAAAPLPARADLAFFASGRSLSVKGHRIEDGRLVLDLRTGGQIVCDPSVITRIEPDEVPYPEDAPAAPSIAVEAAAPLTPKADRHAYDPIITRVAAEQGVDAKLVRAVIQVESAYNERATSAKGAVGLMQLLPATARLYVASDPYEPAANIEAGIRHLRMLLQRFSRPLALAAYNAGEGAVERFGGIPPYPETREYVRRVLSLADLK